MLAFVLVGLFQRKCTDKFMVNLAVLDNENRLLCLFYNWLTKHIEQYNGSSTDQFLSNLRFIHLEKVILKELCYFRKSVQGCQF